ncbi:MAG: hypothetical protein JWN95_2294 [Frankiales bacterium]|nr:hypothetical protein [Frankiales bacterium]
MTTRRWDPPAPLNPRGTLVVLPGRGEHAGVYERFGLRLANDGYIVVALDAAAMSPQAAAKQVSETVTAELVHPLVLVGSDVGALNALLLAADPSDLETGPDAVIAVGTPLAVSAAGPGEDDWDHELDARSACPTHRAKLDADDKLGRGQLFTEPIMPGLAEEASRARPAVPVLFVHGAADSIADPAAVAELARQLPHAVLATVRDGKHDSLNDITHRSAAAQVVQFLEDVRSSSDAGPIITVTG